MKRFPALFPIGLVLRKIRRELKNYLRFYLKGEIYGIRTNRGIDKGLGIGDVSKMCKVPAYTIRFWEKNSRIIWRLRARWESSEDIPKRTFGRFYT